MPPLVDRRAAVPDKDTASPTATAGSSSPPPPTTQGMAATTAQTVPNFNGQRDASPSASSPAPAGRRPRIWTTAMCLMLLKLKAHELGRAPPPGEATLTAFRAEHGLSEKQVYEKLWHLRNWYRKGGRKGCTDEMGRWLDRVFGEEGVGEDSGGGVARRRRRGRRRAVDAGAGSVEDAEADESPSGSSPAAASNSAATAAAAGDAPAADPADSMQQIAAMIAELRGENEALRAALGVGMQELQRGQDELLRRVVEMEDVMAWQQMD
ncbi:hypothetical protein HDU96_010032 [Phlyctochytrium bullatum]|nr:hypothetical protein HDU96_010032 [Phlyctochytrium bullatum]